MSSEKAPKCIYAQEHNSVTIINTLEGIEKINLKKWQQDSLKNISFTNAVGKCQIYAAMASRFLLATYIVQLLEFHFSLDNFSGLKNILARQILHFSAQNSPQYPTEVIISICVLGRSLLWQNLIL